MKAKSFAYSQNITENPNTFIGGVSATISTRAILATTLGIDISRISGFTIVGSDIECKIKGTYGIPVQAFRYGIGGAITSFDDADGLVTSIRKSISDISETFIGSTTLVSVNFPKLVDMSGLFVFTDCTALELVNIPLCETIGTTILYDEIFRNIKLNCVINAKASLATINAGGVEGDLAYAIDSRSATVNYI